MKIKLLDGKGLDYLWDKIKDLVSSSLPKKLSDLDNDLGLKPGVTSFNGETGDVSYSAPVDTVNGQRGTVVIDIPTKTSELLNDSGFLTSHQSLVDYYSKSEVNGLLDDKADVTDIPSLTGYATQDWVTSQGYISSGDIPSLDGYATEQWVTSQGFLTEHQSLSGYATQQWVNQQGFLTSYTETDPVFSSSPAADITSANITSWNGKASSSDAIGSLSLSLNSTNYQLTLSGTKVDGTPFTVSEVIDLPLESVVVSGSYNSTTKKVVLTLQNGSSIDFSVADLVAGLQSEITSSNKLSADLISDGSTNKTVTQTEKDAWDAKVSNVQSDWNASSGLAQILNKPTIPTVPTNVSAFTNDAGYLTEHQDISGKLDVTATAQKTASIPYGVVDSTSTNKVFTATVPGITALEDGTCMLLRNSVVTSASGFTINVNNLGAKPAFSNMTLATAETTIFNINYTMLFVYCANVTVGSVTGAWCCYRGYDSNTTTNSIGYQLRGNNAALPVSDTARYYKMYFKSADGTKWVPASVNSTNNATSARDVNQRPIDPFGEIVYTSANTNYTAGTSLAAGTAWHQYALTLGYSFNRTGAALELEFPKPVYLKCAPQSDGSAIMDADTPIVQTLPSTEDGKIYIHLGIAYSATAIELRYLHPIYYYKDGCIRIWTNQVAGGSSITIDTEPTSDSTNAVSSGGVYTALASKADTSSLATVATTNSYDDLGDKPTIPTVPTNVSAFTNDAGYLTSHQSLTNYVQKSNTTGLLKNDGTVDTNTYLTQHQSLSGYATETWVGQQGYLTSHQDISGKANDSEVVHTTGNETIFGIKTISATGKLQVDDWSNIYNWDDDETLGAVLGSKERTSNKVTSLSSSSTDTQYPSAKCVYDIVGDIQTALTAILS